MMLVRAMCVEKQCQVVFLNMSNRIHNSDF